MSPFTTTVRTYNNNTLDPLKLLSAPTHGESIDNAVRMLAPLLGFDANSAEGDKLRQYLIDRDGLALADTDRTRAPSPSRCSAAVAIMPTSQRSSAEASLAAKRDDEWRAALAGSQSGK